MRIVWDVKSARLIVEMDASRLRMVCILQTVVDAELVMMLKKVA